MTVIPAFGGKARRQGGFLSPKSYEGKICIFQKGGREVRCFHTKKIAQVTARGFGPGFEVRRKR
jgi:hypothetical protein